MGPVLRGTDSLSTIAGAPSLTVDFELRSEAWRPVYQEKRNFPEIEAMGRAFGKVSPARGGQCFAWVTDVASPDERAAVEHDVPAPVSAIIGGTFGRDYRKNIAPIWKS